jgi:ubiquinone biosynthesis protein UbiJ
MEKELEHLITRDAALCEAMADELDDYLKSSQLFWEPDRRWPGGAKLPKLTLGGLLLALRRLETLRDRLDPDWSRALTRAGQELAFQKSHWRVRCQAKLARDLRSRLDTWAWYLDDCEAQGESAIVHYARQVETRVKIELLLDEVAQIKLDVRDERQRQRVLDERLRADWRPGDFCWLEALAAGFPPERFWYLWGWLVERQEEGI